MKNFVFSLGSLADQSEAFLLNWAEKEKENRKVFGKIWRLKELAYRPVEEFPDLALRFRLFEEWLAQEGLRLAEAGLTRFQIEEILAALEKLKLYLPKTSEAGEPAAPGGRLTELAEKFVARLGGFEALNTTAAVSDTPAEEAAAIEATNGDLVRKFKIFLQYQSEYLEHNIRPGEHLLSVVNRLLDALAKRFNFRDEAFAAGLIYFLQAQNYPVGPYLERFRQIKSQVKSK